MGETCEIPTTNPSSVLVERQDVVTLTTGSHHHHVTISKESKESKDNDHLRDNSINATTTTLTTSCIVSANNNQCCEQCAYGNLKTNIDRIKNIFIDNLNELSDFNELRETLENLCDDNNKMEIQWTKTGCNEIQHEKQLSKKSNIFDNNCVFHQDGLDHNNIVSDSAWNNATRCNNVAVLGKQVIILICMYDFFIVGA